MAVSEQPLRVLYLARAPFISGAERALLSQLKYLDRKLVDPGLVLGHESNLGVEAAAQDIWFCPVTMPKRAARSMVGWWNSLRGLRRVIAEFKPDILHANDVPSCQAMSVVGAEMRLPRVLHVRWTISARDASWWARAGVEHVLCISQWIRAQLGDTAGTTLASAKVTVFPDAVDWPATAEATAAQPAVTVPSSIGPSEPTIGFAGQLIPSKGLEIVIRSLAELPVGSRPKLLVAGKDTQRGGEYQDELEELSERLGVSDRIEWLGFLVDVSDLYRRITAAVCPSLEEPLGLVPLEAARFRRPTIANKVGGLAETIVDGRTGWLVEPTPEAWARALKQLSDRAAVARLGQAAYERTRTLYCPDLYQRKLMEIYRELVDKTLHPCR